MNDKQRAFVREYVKDSNATQAAIRAGYSERTAYAQGSRLLKVAEVSAAIAERTERKGMGADEILSTLAEIARDGERDSDRVAALALLGKNQKMFTDKVEHSGSVTLADLVPKRKAAP